MLVVFNYNAMYDPRKIPCFHFYGKLNATIGVYFPTLSHDYMLEGLCLDLLEVLFRSRLLFPLKYVRKIEDDEPEKFYLLRS